MSDGFDQLVLGRAFLRVRARCDRNWSGRFLAISALTVTNLRSRFESCGRSQTSPNSTRLVSSTSFSDMSPMDRCGCRLVVRNRGLIAHRSVVLRVGDVLHPSVLLPSRCSAMATGVIDAFGPAPCQCFVSVGIQTTSPAVSLGRRPMLNVPRARGDDELLAPAGALRVLDAQHDSLPPRKQA